MGITNLARHRKNTIGVMLKQISGKNIKDTTGLMLKVFERIRELLNSTDHADWEIGLNQFNKLLPYALPKMGYDNDSPLLKIGINNNKDGNTQVFIQLNEFIDKRESRKNQLIDLESDLVEIEDNIKTAEISKTEVENGRNSAGK